LAYWSRLWHRNAISRTDFYKEIDEQSLIFETNWDKFDEMHSVYTTKYLTKEKIEEMATYCMAKFWNVDTFLITKKSLKHELNKRINSRFVNERITNLGFMTNNGTELQKDNFEKHIKYFLSLHRHESRSIYPKSRSS